MPLPARIDDLFLSEEMTPAEHRTVQRKVEAEFLKRGRSSLAKARDSGRTVSAKSVIAELDKMIDAKFGPRRFPPVGHLA